MQKKAKNASILIWSMFLSIIISIAFIWVSTKISKNLQENNNLDTRITNEILKDKINNQNYTNTDYLDDWDKIIFEWEKNIIKNIKKDENYKVNFSQSTVVDLSIVNWWPIYYEYFDNTNALSLTWIVIDSQNNIS